MDDWYKASEFKQDQLLDELMCEYVDGTMDPSVRSAFDELVNTNPTIARQVEGLSEAQHILKQTGCSLCAPRQFQSRLRARLDAETGKIHVYGLPDDSHWQPAAFVRYSVLVVAFIWVGIALPRHDFSEPLKSIAIGEQTSQPVLIETPAMTPAMRPLNLAVQDLAVSDNAIDFRSRSQAIESNVESVELELTLLAD
jgi:hypothetical protein